MIELVISPKPSPTIAHLSLEVLNFRGGFFCLPEPWNGVKWWQKYRHSSGNWVFVVKQNVIPPADGNTFAWDYWCLTFTQSWNPTLVCLWRIWLDKTCLVFNFKNKYIFGKVWDIFNEYNSIINTQTLKGNSYRGDVIIPIFMIKTLCTEHFHFILLTDFHLTHLFSKYLLSAHYVLGTILGT